MGLGGVQLASEPAPDQSAVSINKYSRDRSDAREDEAGFSSETESAAAEAAYRASGFAEEPLNGGYPNGSDDEAAAAKGAYHFEKRQAIKQGFRRLVHTLDSSSSERQSHLQRVGSAGRRISPPTLASRTDCTLHVHDRIVPSNAQADDGSRASDGNVIV